MKVIILCQYTTIKMIIDHLNGIKIKSKWTVKIKEEEEIFFHGYNQNWLHEESESIWAIKVEDESPLVIGEDYRPKYKGKNECINLVVAKFVKHRENHWHGYPVNTISDFPPSDILKKWEQSPVR